MNNRALPGRSAAFLSVFGAPLLLAAASAFGLVSALLGDGVWDVVSWCALAVPVGVIIWYTARPLSAIRRTLRDRRRPLRDHEEAAT